jgi:hypothetical protein
VAVNKPEWAALVEKPTSAQASLEHTSVLKLIAPHIFQTLWREPALAITVGYLLVAMAGIFYNYTFYEKFGIPVLTLSQAGDFLVAGIQQPMALLLVASTFPIVWLADRFNLNRRLRRVARRNKIVDAGIDSPWIRLRLWTLQSPPRWFTATAYFVLIILYGWIFVQAYARYRSEIVERGEAPQVSVWLSGASEPLAPKSKAWTYLGAVSNYVFLYDHDARRAQILPVNNITRLQPAEVDPNARHSPIMVAPIP